MSTRRVWIALLMVLLAACGTQGGGSETPEALRDVPPAPTAVPLEKAGDRAEVEGEQPPETIDVPDGFAVTVYAKDLGRARGIAIAEDGSIVVTDLAGRAIDISQRGEDGLARPVVIAEGLNNPHGVAFHQGKLYVGETDKIITFERAAGGSWGNRQVVVSNLPEGGNHRTRSILFGKDGKMYISIGSSCNVCKEEDERRATIMQFDPDGSNGRIFATGLRNAVGLTLHPATNEIWAVDNGRDLIGNDIPPDTVHVVRESVDYGWPRCHAGRIPDPEFGSAQACEGVAKPVAELQAHSAALGLAFYTAAQFPPDYRNNLFVAYHGSWNRDVRTGYKVVRIPIDANGAAGPVYDFATGWLQPGWFGMNGSYWGRPVDLAVAPDGSLLLTDDKAGMVYRISYAGPS